MISNPENRARLKLAAACLATVADSLAEVQCTIDGRLATFENTTEQWSTHPELPNSQLRRLAAPAGAPYQMLEVRSPAGTESVECSISHATDVHVLAGQLLVTRPGRPEEYYGAGTCTRFVANERHTCQVLQDSHRLVIFHLPPTTILHHVK
jgi:hypothetical protein